MISPKKQDKKSMKSTNKDSVDGYFNLTTPIHNIMHNLFYYNISEFAGNLQGILDEGTYKTTIQNMHKLGWKENYSSTLMYQCWVMVVVFHNILSFMKELKINIKCYHIHIWEAIQAKRFTNFCKNHGSLH